MTSIMDDCEHCPVAIDSVAIAVGCDVGVKAIIEFGHAAAMTLLLGVELSISVHIACGVVPDIDGMMMAVRWSS